ncbi:hypothetical protein SAMN05443633_104408 [Chryseobacterium arachidis]|uniref:Uncharacterized protein n=1 Tax=Chryseobacterium arachidis TaxID=1416778 RepID=A0A1M5C5J3_9FLAO|nr:hypothetical protein SAMN05443633_104408 [Chryseobacterium arachidis]
MATFLALRTLDWIYATKNKLKETKTSSPTMFGALLQSNW